MFIYLFDFVELFLAPLLTISYRGYSNFLLCVISIKKKKTVCTISPVYNIFYEHK